MLAGNIQPRSFSFKKGGFQASEKVCVCYFKTTGFPSLSSWIFSWFLIKIF